MLNKMNILLAATAVVALSAGAASADPYDHHDNHDNAGLSVTVGDPGQSAYYGNGYNYGYDDGYARRERDAHYRAETWHAQQNDGALLSIGFGDIAFGYSDGYWDNGHQWHRWQNSNERRNYRRHHGSNFHNTSHSRQHNDGWQR
jgi:hypothetical protein